MLHKSTLKLYVSLSLCLVLGAMSAIAQGTTGNISGTVTDPQGAVVPEVALMIRNLETGQARSVSTDAKGYYRAIALPSGHYEIRVERQGFDPEVRTGLALTVAQDMTVDFTLKLRTVSEQVVIEATPPVVETAGATMSGLVDEKKIRDLPLNGRDMAQLILMQPGVVNSRGSVQSSDTGRGTRFSVAGARPSQNLFALDGTNINDALNNTPGSAQGLLVGVETVKEFRVLTSTYSAEYGRATGGVFLAVTKSGTNSLHGSVFEFLRNNVLDARNFFDSETPAFRRNQFGFTFGGPIVKDRTFFFGSYEGLRESKGITSVSIVPDDNARRGVLPGQAAFTVDSRTVPILELFPHGNGKNFLDGTVEFRGLTKRVSNDDFYTVKVDHSLSPVHSIFVRYLYDSSDQVLPRNFPDYPNLAVNKKQVVTMEDRRVISNRMVNEARIGFNRGTPEEIVPPALSKLSLITSRDVGEVNVSGLTAAGTDRTNPKSFFVNDYQLTDDFSVVKGRHYLKFGAAFERFQYNGDSESRSRGQLRFRSLSDLLRFRVQDLQGASLDSDFQRGYRQWLLGLYAQDEFKFNRRLTLNFGLRYELPSSPTEVNGKVSNLRNVLDPNVTVGAPLFNPTHNNFAPRVGLAYDVTGDGKTAIRSGFGMFFDQPLFSVYRNPIFRGLPFVNRGVIPGAQITSIPVDSSRFKGADATTEVMAFNLRPSYVMQYNLNIQRQVATNTVASLAYVGSRGVNLFGQGDLNTAIPVHLADGRDFWPEGSARRNPNFGITRTIYQGFNSFYNSMNASILKRFSQGLQLQGAYTFGKSIDERSGTSGRQEYENGQARALDPYNRRLDRARSNFDIRNSFVANGSWDLPFGRGLSGWTKQVADGWQLNSILTLSSGVPFGPFVDGDPDRDGTDDSTARPDLVRGVSLIPAGGRSPDHWFNLGAFTPPAVGFRGTAGRNIIYGPNLRMLDVSVVKVFHVGERRTLQFRAEAFNLLNHANFDPPSNAQDGEQIFTFVPAASGKPASFNPTASVGQIFSTVTDSRELQFALKFVF